jgi:transcriptional regulator with XRE-family HTH domain
MMNSHFVNYWASFVNSYRTLHSLTQEQLATQLGVSQQMVSRWEAGQQLPDPRSQAVLRSVLGESDLSSKKNWIERVRRAAGYEALLDASLTLLSVSDAVTDRSDMPAEHAIGRPFANFFPADRPKIAEKAVEAGFFDGALARVSLMSEVNLGTRTFHAFTDLWPVVTSDSGILMHCIIVRVPGPQNLGVESVRVENLVMQPNNLVGQPD